MGRWGIWLLKGLPGTIVHERCESTRDTGRWVDQGYGYLKDYPVQTVHERCESTRDTRRWVDGGYGYLKDYPVQQYMGDARVHEILEGG